MPRGSHGTIRPAAQLDKLETLLARAAPAEEDVAFLIDLLSLPRSERHPLPSLTSQRQKERTLQALIGQLDGLARRQSVLMVFEDAHWIDPTSRELLDLVIERIGTLPVLLVVTFRTEFEPPWTGQPQVTLLALSRLGRRDRTALIDQIGGGKALPAEVADQIAERTDGVPLFIEELTKSVLESGLLREEADRYVLDRALPPVAIPMSLQDSLMARLDRLASVRRVAQVGAAIGREFSYELLKAVVSPISEDELQTSLARLVASELISQRGTPPDAVYTFKHALVQDAAYCTLLRAARQQLHARIATVLKDRFSNTANIQPEILAHHYTRAGLIDPAIRYWRKAGERVLQRSANAEAAAHLTKAIELVASLPIGSERNRTELRLQLALGSATRAIKGHAARETSLVFSRARDLLDNSFSLKEQMSVLYGLWAVNFVRGEHIPARELALQLSTLPDAMTSVRRWP